MNIGDSVTLNLKLSARSTDPVTGVSVPAESFRPIKRGTSGVVEALKDGDGAQAGMAFAVVKFQGLRTRQEIRTDCLTVVPGRNA